MTDLSRFVRRKGLAYGVAWAGTGFGGSATPFILDWLLGAYGPRTTLRIWAVVQVRLIWTQVLAIVKYQSLTDAW